MHNLLGGLLPECFDPIRMHRMPQWSIPDHNRTIDLYIVPYRSISRRDRSIELQQLHRGKLLRDYGTHGSDGLLSRWYVLGRWGNCLLCLLCWILSKLNISVCLHHLPHEPISRRDRSIELHHLFVGKLLWSFWIVGGVRLMYSWKLRSDRG